MDSTLLLEPNQQAQHLLNTRDCQNTTPTSSLVVIQPKAQDHKTHWNLPFYPLFFFFFSSSSLLYFPIFLFIQNLPTQSNTTQTKARPREDTETQRNGNWVWREGLPGMLWKHQIRKGNGFGIPICFARASRDCSHRHLVQQDWRHCLASGLFCSPPDRRFQLFFFSIPQSNQYPVQFSNF